MLDLRASFHITLSRDYFSSFVGKKESAIFMRNDGCCRAIVEGTVQIRMLDGMILHFNRCPLCYRFLKVIDLFGAVGIQGMQGDYRD